VGVAARQGLTEAWSKSRPDGQEPALQDAASGLGPTLSEHNHGFRQKRSAQQAANRVQELLASAHDVVVDIDLEKFFDRVDQTS
jgi:RNA-directed DNA polymerase